MANSWVETVAAPTQYVFELCEVATALIKEKNIHEGRWWAVFELCSEAECLDRRARSYCLAACFR
jgi:hypothetical protein